MEEPKDEKDYATVLKRIKATDAPEVEKVARAFEWVTGRIIQRAHQEIELARALPDQEGLVKQQVKLETVKHARSILQDCYQVVVGRRAWDE